MHFPMTRVCGCVSAGSGSDEAGSVWTRMVSGNTGVNEDHEGVWRTRVASGNTEDHEGVSARVVSGNTEDQRGSRRCVGDGGFWYHCDAYK